MKALKKQNLFWIVNMDEVPVIFKVKSNNLKKYSQLNLSGGLTNTKNHISVYKLFVLNRSTRNHISVYKLLVLNRSIRNHITVSKLLVLNRSTRNHITVCKLLVLNKST